MNNTTTTHNDGNRGHILAIPRNLLALRVLQLIIAVIVMGMCAYGVHYISYDGFCLSLFTAIATMIIVTYILVADFFLPIIYNYWAILVLDIFGVIFWLSSFILMAVEASNFHVYAYYNYYSWFKRDMGIVRRDTTRRTYHNVMAATAAMGALEFVLFIATLVLTAIHLNRHRANGGHAMYNGGAGAPVAGSAVAGPQTHVTKDTELAAHQQHVVEPKDDSLAVQHPAPVASAPNAVA